MSWIYPRGSILTNSNIRPADTLLTRFSLNTHDKDLDRQQRQERREREDRSEVGKDFSPKQANFYLLSQSDEFGPTHQSSPADRPLYRTIATIV